MKQLTIMQKSAITILAVFVTVISMVGCPKEADNMNDSQEQQPTASNPNHPGLASEPVDDTPGPEQCQKADARPLGSVRA